MSIETQLEELNQIKTNIFTSICNKGVVVPENPGLKDAAGLIDQIEGGGGGGGGFDFSDFEIKSKMGKLDVTTFNENDFTIELPNSYSNKDYFNFSSCKITGSNTNTFYSDVRSNGREIDFCSYRQSSGNNNFAPAFFLITEL